MSEDGHSAPASGEAPTGSDGAPDETAEFVELVHVVVRGLHREAGHAPDGATPGQVRLLRTLARTGSPRRLGELAADLDIAPRSVTSKVDQAEQDGWVRRIADPHDRRATLVELTDAGRSVLAQIATRRHTGAADRLGRLTPSERTDLLTLLRRVAAPPPS